MLKKLTKNEAPIKGSLKHYSLSQVLTYLNKQEKTGILTIEDKNVKKSIYIEDGYVVFASSNQGEDRLGEMLVRAGKLTPEQCDESLKLSKQTGKPQGMTLIELGYLTPKDLYRKLQFQIKEIILSLFLWEGGTFSFKETSESTQVLKMRMDNLIREGTSRRESKKREEESSFLQTVNELYEDINTLSYYDILGIEMKAPPSEIRKAYLKMSRDYHPDRCQDFQDPPIKDKLTVLFTFLNKAYYTLSNETEKAEYDAALLKKVSKKAPNNEIIKAGEQFKRGLEEFKKGNFWGAADFLRWATKKDPKKANYWAHLSLALSNMQRRHKEAEETILKAIELEPHNADYYVHLGKIYLQAGIKKRAAYQFETALGWDPTNKRAQTELEKLKKGK